MIYEKGDVITYTAKDGYTEEYIVVDIRDVDNIHLEPEIKLEVLSYNEAKPTATVSIGWFACSVFRGGCYSVRKFELQYDPTQMPDEEDDI